MARAFLSLLMAGAYWGAQGAGLESASPIIDPEREGTELAARLRNSAPAENSEFRGQLETRNGKFRTTSLRSRIKITPTNWQVTYSATGTNPEENETLTITHAAGQTNQYRLVIGTNQPVTPELMRPFAGAEFWVQDLGLEFLHWPKQKALRAEMSRGQPCRVLESVNPRPPPHGYARVLSWIDVENGGLLQAEAYDGQGKLLKKFTLGSFEKVEGVWQLRDMKIRNARSGQTTQLKFDLDAEASKP